LAAAVLFASPSRLLAGSYLQRDAAPPDSSAGALVVETVPPGLLIRIDGVEAGRSPLGPVWLPARTVRVRALPEDPRHFDNASDEAEAVIRPGSTARVFLDLRPSVMLRSRPEPARVYRVTGAPARDSLLGETPLSVRPALFEGSGFRFRAPDHADTTLTGLALLDLERIRDPVTIPLRRITESLPPTPPKIAFYRHRWLQWGLVGVGAVLTGTAAILRREGDQWYDRYLESSDRRVLDTYFDRAVRYDHLSLASLGVGQVLFTGGLALLVSGSSR
jgi:hypothetical protein